MASLPQQQQQQPPRRTEPRQPSHDSRQSHRGDSEEASSTTSIDSQTVLLGNGPASSFTPSSSLDTAALSDITPQSTPPQPRDDDDVRRCWICYNDETDDESARVWRTPCPCALTAHESCLLDWVADLEKPDGNRTTAGHADIKCPQCKSPILLSRPHSKILDYAGALERFASHAILPITVMGITNSFRLVSAYHGVHTIKTIFGDADALVILAPCSRWEWNWLEREAAARFPDVALPFLRRWRGWRVELGVPLIPVALIASRTQVGDAILPFLPILFFASHGQSHDASPNGRVWPPSAALTLCLLPYVRSAYNEYMERVWRRRERAWIEEIRPHFGESDDGLETGNDAGGVGAQDQPLIDIRIDVDIAGAADEEEEDDDDDDVEEREEADEEEARRAEEHIDDARMAEEQPPPAHRQDLPEDLRAEAARLGDMGPQPPEDIAIALEAAMDEARQRRPPRRRQRDEELWEGNLDIIRTLLTAAETSVGALLFPSIAAASGELLRLLLPRALTAVPTSTKWRAGVAGGLLQTKWGRSIVGGCLFVAMKDAIRVYCRWRMAVSFRERKVRDYDKTAGVYV